MACSTLGIYNIVSYYAQVLEKKMLIPNRHVKKFNSNSNKNHKQRYNSLITINTKPRANTILNGEMLNVFTLRSVTAQ